MNNIIRYAAGHRNTQLAFLSITETGLSILRDMHDKLCFSKDEEYRMENEGGTPLSDEQTATLDICAAIALRIKKLLLAARYVFVSGSLSISIHTKQEKCHAIATHQYYARLLPEYSYDRSGI